MGLKLRQCEQSENLNAASARQQARGSALPCLETGRSCYRTASPAPNREIRTAGALRPVIRKEFPVSGDVLWLKVHVLSRGTSRIYYEWLLRMSQNGN